MKKTMIFSIISVMFFALMILMLSCSNSSSLSSQPSDPDPQPVVVHTWYQSQSNLAGDDTEMIPAPNIIETADTYLFSLAFHNLSAEQDSTYTELFRLEKSNGMVKSARISDSLLVDMVHEASGKLLMAGQTISNVGTGGISVQADNQGTVSASYPWPNLDGLVRVCALDDRAVFAGYTNSDDGRYWTLLGANEGNELWRTAFDSGRVFDPASTEAETVKLVRIADIVEDPGNGIAVLAQLEKQGTGNPISGFAIGLFDTDNGILNWSRAWYAEPADADLYPVQLLIQNDGTFLVSYGWQRSFNGAFNSYVLNIDRNGDTIWSDHQYGFFSEPARNMALLADGSVLIATTTGGDYEDYGNGPELLVADIDIRKLDRNGRLVWTRDYETGRLRQVFSIVPTSDGGMIVASSALGTNELTNENYVKGFVVYKLNADGKCPDCK